MVIATNVACRAAPETSAAVVSRSRVGEVFPVRDIAEAPDGVWYLNSLRRARCWIHGSLTTDASDRERALLAAADRLLSRADDAPFEDYVAVNNLLNRVPLHAHSDSTILQASPLLQLRQLQLLERAAQTPGAQSRSVADDPLKFAWFFAHRDVLRYHDPAASWFVNTDVFWRLYEQHRHTQWAEEIAWAAAQGAVPGDECDAACHLRAFLRTYGRYLAVFPRGRWVEEALVEAGRRAEYAAEAGCQWDTPEDTRLLVENVRQSLAEVTAPGKAAVLARLGAVVQRCR